MVLSGSLREQVDTGGHGVLCSCGLCWVLTGMVLFCFVLCSCGFLLDSVVFMWFSVV